MFGLNNKTEINSKTEVNNEKIEKQHKAGKLTAQERVDLLFDKGSFTEVDKELGDGVITGYGNVNGKRVYVASQDFTYKGGTLGYIHSQRICKIMDMAYEDRCPFITINDSGGARINEGIDSLSGYSGIFLRNTRASGVIPQIAVIMGPCAGGACYSPAICDFIFMVRNTSQMFITGPGVVKSVTGETTTVNELGGAEVHTHTSGVADFVYDDDRKCIEKLREFLLYLPQNYESKVPEFEKNLKDNSSKIADIIPDSNKKAYDVKQVIDAITDEKSFLEIQQDYAKNIVIGLARFEGKVTGIVANQPSVIAGCLDVNASDKAARFIRFCDCFSIPLVVLVDVPGYMPGTDQEHKGIIRHGAKLLYAFSEATVPKVTLIMRKAYGGAYIAMNSKKMGGDIILAWPSAEMAVMGAEGAVDILYKKKLQESSNPEELRKELVADYEAQLQNHDNSLNKGYIDKIIEMADTRKEIMRALKSLESKPFTEIKKKHGNIPL